jgi:hypothetical protein
MIVAPAPQRTAEHLAAGLDLSQGAAAGRLGRLAPEG